MHVFSAYNPLHVFFLARVLRAGELQVGTCIPENFGDNERITSYSGGPMETCEALVIRPEDRVYRTFTPLYRGHGLRIGTWNIDSCRTTLTKVSAKQQMEDFVKGERVAILCV